MLGIEPIDMVVVNLYPFEATIAKEGVGLEEVIENIDIGGPTMIRSAAKNAKDVAVVVDPGMYSDILKEMRENKGALSEASRMNLAIAAFKATARYDSIISSYLEKRLSAKSGKFPESLVIQFEKAQDLRYGENPHQEASFYKELYLNEPSIATAQQLHGKELSFNNINDANAAIEMVKDFNETTVVAVKHTNPCGLASADTLLDAYNKAYESDPVSIFGGIIALNRELDAATAKAISSIFVEIVIAPDFQEEALEILMAKKNLRLLRIPGLGERRTSQYLDMKRVLGGMLIQDADTMYLDPSELQVVTDKKPTDDEMRDLLFAWKVVKHVKSNAIVVVKDNATIGVGAGQMNRINSARLAFEQAGEKSKGAVLASDAFFPFPDVVEAAGKAGISAIIQPGGSIRDDESIKAANALGIAMIFTGIRHFKH
jgi:phosphoribosylaminoimidazolecarboxamide formyltransferase/IMP cyclohydrolase